MGERIVILGTKARYAVMAMVDLARQDSGSPTCLSDIAARQEISLAYLEQIFLRLKKNGLVRPVRGPGGGYLLARAAHDTSIADIVIAADESLKMTRCNNHDGGGCMSDKARCLTHGLWEGLGNHIYDYLQQISLADVYDEGKGKGEVDPIAMKRESSGV